MRRIKNILKVVASGRSIKDKSIILFYYLFKFPLNKNANLNGDVYLKNNIGDWYVGKYSAFMGTCSEDYENEVRKELSIDKGIFIDVGACIGRHTIEVAKRGVKVYAFEPMPLNYTILKKNIKLNKLNVKTFNLAVSDRSGTQKFYLHGDVSGGHSLVRMDKHNKKIIVKTVKLDDYDFGKVDLIKIDVEDNEINVLRGAKELIKRDLPKIVFECYGYNKYRDIDDFLMQFGYLIERLDYLNYVAKIKHKRGGHRDGR